MFQRFLTILGVFALLSVAFAQDVAPAPWLGYKESYQMNYVSNMTVGGTENGLGRGTYVNVMNAGGHGGSTAEGGDICVNVYTYDPDEQPRNCCTCRLSPNEVRSLTAADLSVPLFPGPAPTSVTVKLVATTVPTTGCDAARRPSAIGTAGGFAVGMRAFATHIHIGPPASPIALYATETKFAEAPLSEGELNKLTMVCTFIKAFASGNGICKSCTLGARGPVTK